MSHKTDKNKAVTPAGQSTIFDEPSLLGNSQVKNGSEKSEKKTDKRTSLSCGSCIKRFSGVLRALSSTRRTLLYLCTGIVCVAVLLFCLLLPSSCESSDEHDHNHEVSSSDTENITNEDQLLLIDLESDELDYMVLTNVEGTFTIVKDTENGALVIKELEGLPQNEDFIEMLWYDALSVGYSYQIAPAAVHELSEYGFDEPTAQVNLYYSDGTTSSFTLGNLISGTQGDHYLIVDGYDGVYVNYFDDSYQMGSKYWLSDDVFGYDTDGIPEIGKIKVQTKNGEIFTIEPHTAVDASDPFYDRSYIITEPYDCAVYEYYMSSLLEELGCFVAYEALCPFPTDAELKQYGLDKPDATVTHQRNGSWYTISIAKADYDYFYCIIDGIDIVYQFDANSYPILSQISLELLRSSEVHVRHFEAIERFCISCGSERYEFRISRTPYYGEETVFEYTILLNDVEIETHEYKEVLEIFNTAAATAFDAEADGDSAYLTIEIDYFDNFSAQDEIIEYIPCGSRRYICRINGDGEAVLSQLWVDNLLSAVKNFLD